MKDYLYLFVFGVLGLLLVSFLISPNSFNTVIAAVKGEPMQFQQKNMIPATVEVNTSNEPRFYQDNKGQIWVGINEGTNTPGSGIFLCSGVNEMGQQYNIIDSGNLIGLHQDYILKVLKGCGLQ